MLYVYQEQQLNVVKSYEMYVALTQHAFWQAESNLWSSCWYRYFIIGLKMIAKRFLTCLPFCCLYHMVSHDVGLYILSGILLVIHYTDDFPGSRVPHSVHYI